MSIQCGNVHCLQITYAQMVRLPLKTWIMWSEYKVQPNKAFFNSLDMSTNQVGK